MKNLLMIAIAFVTITATAQERKKEDHKGDRKERMQKLQDMTPEETAEFQTKKMTLQLDLNEKQQAEVKKLFKEEATTRKAKMEEFKAKKEKADGEKLSKEDRMKMQNERLDNQIEMKKKMKAILNDDQYAKFEKMQEERQEKRGDHAKMRKNKE